MDATAGQAAQLCPDAEAAAAAAARAAGVVVRDLHELAELAAACDLFDAVWDGLVILPPALARALTAAGNYVSGAYDGTGLVGACFGFFGPPATACLHSDVAAVAPAARDRSVGFALKTHQRAWALRRGVTRITWTFDPLMARNAYFNLAKLGAGVGGYLADFYGAMTDVINAGDESDRLVADWDLTADRVARACHGTPEPVPTAAELRARGAVTGLSADGRGAPVTGSAAGPLVLVGVPPDTHRLRRTDPGVARAWRYALRDVLGGLLRDGAQVTGFVRSGWYVLDRTGPAQPAPPS